MFGIKIILTVIITLALIAGFLGTNPAVSGFFDSVGGRLSSFLGDSTPRDIEFALVSDRYGDFSFSSANSNFTISGYSEAALKTGNLRTNKTLGVYGFRGSGSVAGNTVVLDGRMSKVELPEITIAVQETIKSNSTFTSMSISSLGLKELKIENTSGTLTVRGASTQFSGGITISSPSGNFGFYNSSKFTLSGRASRISIPSAGILIE